MLLIAVCPHVDIKREDLLAEFSSHKDPLRRIMIMEMCEECCMESILAMKPQTITLGGAVH